MHKKYRTCHRSDGWTAVIRHYVYSNGRRSASFIIFEYQQVDKNWYRARSMGRIICGASSVSGLMKMLEG